MEKTLNQLMRELETIATEHRQIDEFFQGDFLDAVSRDELAQFTARLNQYAINSSDSDITRFRPLGSLSGNIDITSYGIGIDSLEDVIINEPLVDAFYGKQKCSFCPTTLILEDASELLTHFMQEHMVLLDAYFHSTLFQFLYLKILFLQVVSDNRL